MSETTLEDTRRLGVVCAKVQENGEVPVRTCAGEQSLESTPGMQSVCSPGTVFLPSTLVPVVTLPCPPHRATNLACLIPPGTSPPHLSGEITTYSSSRFVLMAAPENPTTIAAIPSSPRTALAAPIRAAISPILYVTIEETGGNQTKI